MKGQCFVGCVILFGLTILTPVFAAEIWVAPSEDAADKQIGNWAVSKADTHFGFAVPDNLDSGAPYGAKVAVIGTKAGAFDYEVVLSISQNGLDHYSYTDSLSDSGLLVVDQVLEIDVSTILPALVPGVDYVSLHFYQPGGGGDGRDRARVVGLRFWYAEILDVDACPAGSSIQEINPDGTVVCEVDDQGTGTVTSINTGTGLTGGPITGSGTISVSSGGITSDMIQDGTVGSSDVNSTQLQLRIGGSCPEGQSIREVSDTGTVVCEPDDVGITGPVVTQVTATAPLVSSGGATPNLSLNHVVIESVNNTGLGLNALRNITSGHNNTASGADALENNTEGIHNTASGSWALSYNTTGSDNTASGANALRTNTTGSGNTASGTWALVSNTTGSMNIASGSGALYSNTTGSDNTASGYHALASNTTGDENTASGKWALVNNTDGGGNIAVGYQALYNNTTGSGNTAVGYGALWGNYYGFTNTAIGAFTNVTSGIFYNATAIGFNTWVDASDKIRLGNNHVTVIEGNVGFTWTSDKNKKENFRPVDGEEVLQKIRSLEIPSWNLIGQDAKQFRHYGPMAQDVFAAFGNDGVGNIGSPTTINTSDLLGILMIAVQALERRTAENAELKVRIEALERTLIKMPYHLASTDRVP